MHLQMISIQDENVLPPAFQKAMDRVRAGGLWLRPIIRCYDMPAALCT